MAKVRARDTQPELIVRSRLHRAGFRFRLHRKDLPGKPDIVLPRYKAAVFVHGCFWHGHDCKKGKLPTTNVEFWRDKIGKNRTRDRGNVAKLESLGWRVYEVWECNLEAETIRLIETLSTEKNPKWTNRVAPGTK